MHLLMFDVDGTLIRSNEYDAECFVRAVSITLGISDVDSDWRSYEHVTDSGITAELVKRNYGRKPTQAEVRLIQERFLVELDRAFDVQPCLAQAIEGAIEFVAAVRNLPDIAVSIATGGWETSCRKKLEKSGFCINEIPLASADDALSRIEIMDTSLGKARKTYQQSVLDSITYVGDGPWDLKASLELGWNFIAVGEPILTVLDNRPRYWIEDFTKSRELDRILEDIRRKREKQARADIRI